MLFKSICLSGGGILGFAHVGFLQKLFEKNPNIYSTVDTIVATSVGTIVALMFAINIAPNEMFAIMKSIDSKRVLKFSNIANFLQTFGIDSGDFFIAHLVDVLISNNVNPTITFSEFYKKFGKRLIYTGTNLTNHTIDYFSIDTTPDMRVLVAIQISIAIPFLFEMVKWNNCYYVDGGIMDPYPIYYCIHDFKQRFPLFESLNHIIGCNVDPYFTRKNNSLENYVYNLCVCTRKKLDNNYNKNELPPCTVYVHDSKLGSSINFDIDFDERKMIWDLGYSFTNSFLRDLKLHKISRRKSI